MGAALCAAPWWATSWRKLALDNGWAGIVVYGCVRDAATLAQMPIGVKALAALPRRSEKRGSGQVGIPVTFAGVTFTPGHYLYADAGRHCRGTAAVGCSCASD